MFPLLAAPGKGFGLLVCGCDPLDSYGVRDGDTLQCTGFATHQSFDRYFFLHQQQSGLGLIPAGHGRLVLCPDLYLCGPFRLLCRGEGGSFFTRTSTLPSCVSFHAAALLFPLLLPGKGFRVGGRC